MDLDTLFASVMFGWAIFAALAVGGVTTRRNPPAGSTYAVSVDTSVAVPSTPHRLVVEAAQYRPTWLKGDK